MPDLRLSTVGSRRDLKANGAGKRPASQGSERHQRDGSRAASVSAGCGANTVRRCPPQRVHGPRAGEEIHHLFIMTPKKSTKTTRSSPKKADATVTVQQTSTRVEGIDISVWRQRRTDELTRKSLPTIKVIAEAYDIDIPARPTKAGLVSQVIGAEEKSFRSSITEGTGDVSVVDDAVALWPEVNPSRSQQEADSMYELAILLETKLKISEDRSRGFVEQSGIISVSELAVLDETACAELVSQHKFGTVVASKFRGLCKEIRSGTGVGVDEGNRQARTGGNQRPTGTLGPPPRWEKDSRWSSWKERFDDWAFNAQERNFSDAEMYAKLRESFPDTVTSLFYKIRPSPGERTLERLVEFLKDRYAGWEQIDKREEVSAFRACSRGNRDLKVFRIEWESLREGCIAKNLIDRIEKDSHWQLLRAANLNAEQTSTVMKAFDLAGTEEPEVLVRIALEEFGRMERTWEFLKSGRRNDPGNRNAALFAPVRKDIQKKGKGAGKGKKDGSKSKGKGKGSGGNQNDKKDCRFGSKCNRADCHFKHPKGWNPGKQPSGGKPSGKGKGKGGKKQDWKCPTPDCGVLVFGSKDRCFKCGAAKPSQPNHATP